MRIRLHEPSTGRWLEFRKPKALFCARSHAEVRPLLAALERQVETEGLYAAGFITYEAAAGFDTALQAHEPGPLPLLSFGLFDKPTVVAPPGFDDDESSALLDWQLDTGRDTYTRCIAAIREQIALGNCYQVNYTMRAVARSGVRGWPLFQLMAQDAPYAAWIETDDFDIACASPELFLERNGEQLTSRPMKGTARRGLWAEDDRKQRAALAGSAKDRAENVMIADMLRNDLGRVAEPGSVRGESLYTIEKYPTVWQATSTVTARSGATLADLLAATFPCASITGAPKVASMQVIRELELSPRGIYTGTIGYFGPGRRAQFNVAIRTATIDRRDGSAVYGVGGGIVWDSLADSEFDECLAKARILRRRWPRGHFRLLETMRWDDGYRLLERHLARLQASADYFDFRIDMAAVRDKLLALAAGFDGEPQRVRLLLSADGAARIEVAPLALPAEPVRLRLADEPVDRDDVRLYHKTTSRELYDRAREQAGDCDDVVLWNRDGELTETTIANLALRIDGEWLTPPLSSGLLPGTLRAELLALGRLREEVLPVAALENASAIEVLSALRGRRPAMLA